MIAASAHFTRRFADGAAAPRLHVHRGRCAPLRARERPALRRDRLRQLPSGAQRLGGAVHGGALRRRCAVGSSRAACSASGCRCTSSISTPCAASCSRSWRSIREAGRCSRATASRRRCSVSSGARDATAASTSRRARAIGWRAWRCRSESREPRARRRARRARQLRRGARGAAALRGRRRRQHRRSSGGGVPRAAHHLRARFEPARPADRAAARALDRARRADSPARPIQTGPVAWPPTGRRATASSSRAATCGPRRGVQDMLAQVREPLLSVLRISPDFRPAYDPLLAMATALAGRMPPARARCSPS